MTNSALQVTNFNFYGDELIALKDNATGEIYVSINSVFKGIGFTDKNQIRKRRDKWINDFVISKGIAKFIIPIQKTVPKKDTTLFDEKETYCISQRKLPLALAKINITPKMKQSQPELASKLELYQDKCADVLASVFIDNKSIDNAKLELLSEKLKYIAQNQERILTKLDQTNEKSLWLKNTLSNLGLIQAFLDFLDKKNILSDTFKPKHGKITFSWTIHIVISQAESINSKILFNEYKNKYESETGCICKRILDFIEYYQETKEIFTETLFIMLNTFKAVIREENENRMKTE